MNTGVSLDLLQSIDEGQRMAYRSLWDVFIPFFGEHWIALTTFFAIIYTIAIARALYGYWGMLGSVLYNSLFLGVLLVIGIIWGPEVFGSNYVGIGLAILYFSCYFMVGKILDWTGLRRRGSFF